MKTFTKLIIASLFLGVIALAQSVRLTGPAVSDPLNVNVGNFGYIDAGLIRCASDIIADGNITTGAAFQASAVTAPNVRISYSNNANVTSTTCAWLDRGTVAFASGDCIWGAADENGNPIVRVVYTGTATGRLELAASSDLSGSTTSDTSMRTFYSTAANAADGLSFINEAEIQWPSTKLAEVGTALVASAAGGVSLTDDSKTCTLNGGSPSTCTATVRASSICVATPTGTTAGAGIGLAVSLASTTLTVTGPNGNTQVVNIWCDR